MNIFFEEHRQLIAAMVAANVRFLLIGGYAVNYHGYNRTTGDMDLWLRPDNDNKKNLIRALEQCDIDPEDLHQIDNLDFTVPLVFNAWEPPYRADFLTKVSGVDFDLADKEKIVADIDGLTIPVINLHHLVLTKFGTGRPKDELDITTLQDIQKKKK